MTELTGERFLQSIRHLDEYINSLDVARCKLLDPRQDILDLAAPHGGMGDRVQSGIHSKTEDLGIRLADLPVDAQRMKRLRGLAEIINKKIDELVDKKAYALRVIDSVEDNRYKMVLTQRYINGLKWSSIADIMGYAQNWVEVDLRKAAVCAYEKAEAKTTM